MTHSEAFLKASHFCAYQERTQQEVREKLHALGCCGDNAEEVIVRLIQENYLNEERFAKSFVGGKFRIKKWGRIKILHELKQKGLSNYCSQKGIEEIDDEQYIQTLESILCKKKELLGKIPIWTIQKKMAQYAISKGYESDLVWEKIKEICKD